MAIVAEAYVLTVDLPYSEYWLPLAIGMGVGLCAVTVSKLVFERKKPRRRKPEQAVPDPFTAGSHSEQRKSYRRQGNPTGVFIALPDQKDKPMEGWVLDRSMGGICLQANSEFAPDTQLAVLPMNAPTMTPWVDIQVKTCRPLDDEGYELGCQFIKTPAWSILLMFG